MRRLGKGFTLIEVMLAIALLGLLLVLVGTALTTARRALASSEAYAARLDEVRAAQQFLRRELQQVLPAPPGDAAVVAFQGGPTELRYIASLPAHLGSGLYVQTLRLGNLQATPWLQVEFTRLTGPDTGQPWGAPQPLLRDVRHLRFSYQGLDAQGHPTPWLPHWPWPQSLPQQIEINLDSTGPITWPPLRVALRLQSQATLAGPP